MKKMEPNEEIYDEPVYISVGEWNPFKKNIGRRNFFRLMNIDGGGD